MITEDDNKFVEELVQHVTAMVRDYEYNRGVKICFDTELDLQDDRELKLTVLPKDHNE